MMSRAVEERLRTLAQALWLKYNIVQTRDGKKWMSYNEVMKEVRSLFKHTQTRRFYFEKLVEYGYLKKEVAEVGKSVYIAVDPSEIKTRDVNKYLQELRKSLLDANQARAQETSPHESIH